MVYRFAIKWKAETTLKEGMKMPWEERTVERMREEFVNAAKSCSNLSRLCWEYNISRPTAYKWLKRSAEGESLSDRSHKPHTVPKKTGEEVEQAILEVRRENPGWGGKTIRKVLLNSGLEELPSARTCSNILKRSGCISEEESQKRKAFLRFEKESCNEMWQTDFKGDFKLGDGSRCYPLTIIDDHSRYSIMIDAKPNTLGVKDSFIRAFESFGMPQTILSDNGPQFAGFGGGYNQFEKWLMEHDVLPVHGRIYHPQTQGKIERFHRAMKDELLKHRDFSNLQEADEALQNWREKYNTIRPHRALDMLCPNEVYVPSKRYYTEKAPAYEYDGTYHVIKVNSWGYVRFAQFQMFLSESMRNEYVEFRPCTNEDRFLVCFRNFGIADFDTNTGKLLNRSATRL